MNRVICGCVALLLSVATPALAQTSVAGDWDVTIVSPQGPNTVRVVFKQDGEKISGVFKSQMGELPFEDGSLTGDDLKFAFTIPVQGMQLEITLTGKVEGSSMAGKAQFGTFGEGDWTAKRAPAEAAATPAPAAPAPAAAAPAVAKVGGLSGQWDVVLKTQIGDLPATVDIKDADGKLTGTLTGPQGSIDIAGTFDGNAVKLEFVAKTPQGDIPITMTGDVSGDSINGKADFGGMGQGDWTAKRKS